MTTLDRPLSRPRAGTDRYDPSVEPNPGSARQDRLGADTFPSSNDPLDAMRLDVAATGLDPSTVNSYGTDGFTPARSEKCGASNPQDDIDLEALAAQIFLLLRREAYIERERHGAVR